MLALLPWALTTAVKRDLGIDLSWILSTSTTATTTTNADDGDNYCHDQWEGKEEEQADFYNNYYNNNEYYAGDYEDDNRTVVTLTSIDMTSSEPNEWFDADDGVSIALALSFTQVGLFIAHKVPAFRRQLVSLQTLLNHPEIVEALVQHAPRLRFLSVQTYYHSLKALPISFLNTHHTRRLTLEPPVTDTLWIGDIGNVLTHTPFLTSLHLAGSSASVSNLLAKMVMDACPLLTDLSVSTSDAITHGFLRRLRLPHLDTLSLEDLPGLPAQTALVIALEHHPQLRSLKIIKLPIIASSGASDLPDGGVDQAQPHTSLRILDVSYSAIPTPMLPLLTPNLTSLAMRSMPWQINLPPIVHALPHLTHVDVRGSRGNTGAATIRPGVTVLDEMLPYAGDEKGSPLSLNKSGVPLTTRLVRAFSM
ncbi:hypothetical protein HDU86_005088 [Geranomyces michiganensis]|nr:hypothetical protein HDU86_005088 [Geranomyces michiganensis]